MRQNTESIISIRTEPIIPYFPPLNNTFPLKVILYTAGKPLNGYCEPNKTVFMARNKNLAVIEAIIELAEFNIKQSSILNSNILAM